jgi:Rrf2 family nitric oxide-sensitive transcriptional repressor
MASGGTAMRLTAYTDYSLRVLMRLALRPQELTTIADIARAYRISEHHLMKVVHQLGRAGYIETVRGRGGGLRLARDPTAIWLGDVVRRTEPDLDLVECFR